MNRLKPRSLPHLIQIVTDLGDRGVDFKSLKETIDTSSPAGKLVFHMMGAMAEFERDLLKERINSGISNARAKGKTFGRPRGGKIADSCDRINMLRARGESVRSIAKIVGLSPAAVGKCPRCEVSEGMEW